MKLYDSVCCALFLEIELLQRKHMVSNLHRDMLGSPTATSPLSSIERSRNLTKLLQIFGFVFIGSQCKAFNISPNLKFILY